MVDKDSKQASTFAGRLRRLDPNAYMGSSFVHWTMVMDERRSGWLCSESHLDFRDSLCHALSRENLVCLAYCLMPDHCHLLWAGLHCQSDQSQAMRQFRRDWNVRLKPYSLDRQAYDHVLRAKERERDALQKVMAYIWNNPVRKGLASEREDWEFSGTFFPGYPTLDFRKEYFYVNLWKAFNEQVERFG